MEDPTVNSLEQSLLEETKLLYWLCCWIDKSYSQQKGWVLRKMWWAKMGGKDQDKGERDSKGPSQRWGPTQIL